MSRRRTDDLGRLYSLITGDASQESVANALFGDHLIRKRPECIIGQTTSWASTTAITAQQIPGELIAAWIDKSDYANYYFDMGDVVSTLVIRNDNDVTFTGYCATGNEKAFTEAVTKLQRLLPVDKPSERQEVRFKFWMDTKRGPQSVSRAIAAHAWDEVAVNYSHATQTSLSHLMHKFKPSHGGQLLLWYGLPGTGKTHAIRTLAWEWRDWCKFEYVVDPEMFFGRDAAYMLKVLLDASETHDYDTPENGKKGDKWRCFILEDTGELLAADAKQRAGQGMSRLLNVVDGIIGQGLKALVLVTTNEELRELHPAVTRPGRCAAQVEFEPMTPDEARIWMKEHGHDPDRAPQGRRPSLAELYGEVEGYERGPERVVGFAGGRR